MDCSSSSTEDQAALLALLMDIIASNPDAVSGIEAVKHTSGDDIFSNFDQDRFFLNSVEAAPAVSGDNLFMPFTTMMIRNIPRKCTQRMLVADIIAAGFRNTMDFVYLPTDISSAKNLGYAFVNFVQPEYAKSFRDIFHKKHLASTRGSRAGLTVSFAIIQGLQANVENVMKNASVHRIRNPEYLPLVLNEGRLVPCYMGPQDKRRNSYASAASSSAPSSPQLRTYETDLLASLLSDSTLKAY